jgi:alkylation response protein AidB-like acyl-CoA dehydrogenase
MTSEQMESPELQRYRTKARAWLADNLVKVEVGEGDEESDPGPERIEEERRLQEHLHRAGYVGFTIPVDYGGLGLTPQHERIFLEEARSYRMPGQNFGVSIQIIGATLAAFGTEEQKRARLPRILSGRELWMQLLSEPSGGSDLAGLLTTAVRDVSRPYTVGRPEAQRYFGSDDRSEVTGRGDPSYTPDRRSGGIVPGVSHRRGRSRRQPRGA